MCPQIIHPGWRESSLLSSQASSINSITLKNEKHQAPCPQQAIKPCIRPRLHGLKTSRPSNQTKQLRDMLVGAMKNPEHKATTKQYTRLATFRRRMCNGHNNKTLPNRIIKAKFMDILSNLNKHHWNLTHIGTTQDSATYKQTYSITPKIGTKSIDHKSPNHGT